MSQHPLQAVFDKIQALRDAGKHAVMGVFIPESELDGSSPADKDAAMLPWAYTVGLTDRKLPELVISGLPVESATVVLNAIAEDPRFSSNESMLIQPEGFPLAFALVDVKEEKLRGVCTLAFSTFGASARFLQVIWPDTQGKFPWDEGYESRFLATQLSYRKSFKPVLKPAPPLLSQPESPKG